MPSCRAERGNGTGIAAGIWFRRQPPPMLPSMDPLYFEDFHPGQRFESAPARMERDRIAAFAAEFDPQPQHINETEAATSMFGQFIASGWHTASQTMRLQFDALISRFPGGGMGAQIDNMAWRRPVQPGDDIRAVIEVLETRPSRSRPDRGILNLRTTTLNQRDETVMEMTAAIFAPCRNAKAR